MKIRMQTRKELADDYDAKHPKLLTRPERMWRKKGKYDSFIEGVQGWSIGFRASEQERFIKMGLEAGAPTKAGDAWMKETIKYDTAKMAWVKEQVKKQIEEAGVQTLDDGVVDICYSISEGHEVDDHRMMKAITTQKQKDWLADHNLTMDELFNGGYQCSDEEEVHEVLFGPWNEILKANGLGAHFTEEPIFGAMEESIKENLGPGIESIEFVDDDEDEEEEPCSLCGWNHDAVENPLDRCLDNNGVPVAGPKLCVD